MTIHPYIVTIEHGPIGERTPIIVFATGIIHAHAIGRMVCTDDGDGVVIAATQTPIYIDGMDDASVDALIVNADGVNGIDIDAAHNGTCAIVTSVDDVTPLV